MSCNYPDYFETQARQTPAALAASCKDATLTFAALDAHANAFAESLIQHGVRPEVLVAVCLERSLDLLISLLGIWKAGGAYLPLDPAYPKDRLAFMLSDSRAQLLVSRPDLLNLSTSLPKLLLSSGETLCFAQTQTPRRLTSASCDDLAYVIYTSGSTGRPKGVEITHRCLLNHNLAITRAYALRSDDRVLQFASPGFDVSVEEIFPTWLSGSTVVLRTEETSLSAAAFMSFVAKERITVLNLPTAFWHELVDSLHAIPLPPSVRLVVIGGEQASPQAFKKWKRYAPTSVSLINSYGPTEATVTATFFHADPNLDHLPIGHPISNMHALVIDQSGQPAQPGKMGELYLGGPGLARGYRHQPALTAERFVPNTFGIHKRINRFYRTGDLVRVGFQGNLEFIGRTDRQVKIRGFRIELAEVEAALAACPVVKNCAVLARPDQSGRKRLVAYYVPRSLAAPATNELLRFVQRTLPNHMVPSTLVPVEALPLSPSGKVDPSALPSSGPPPPVSPGSFVRPRTRIESQLADIWREVLQVSELSITDNFFELGGDSLLGMQLIARIRETFKIELPPAIISRAQTIAELATRLASNNFPLALEPFRTLPRSQSTCIPASFVQELFWVLHELNPQSAAYNMPLAFRIGGKLNVLALQQALMIPSAATKFFAQRSSVLKGNCLNSSAKTCTIRQSSACSCPHEQIAANCWPSFTAKLPGLSICKMAPSSASP